MKWEDGGCSHAIAHFPAGETEAQGDGITCLRLHSVGGAKWEPRFGASEPS